MIIIVDEELGYPHELIIEALNQSTTTINSQYHYRVKLLAALVKRIFENQEVDLPLQNSTDPVLSLLESLVRRSGIKEATENVRLELGKALTDYSTNPIRPSYDKFMGLLKEAILLHIICKESFKNKLLDSQEIANYLNVLDFDETESQAILSAIQLWISGKNKGIPYSIIFEFTRLTNSEIQNAAIFLTYELAVDNTEFKRELLYTHYLLVKKVVNDFRSIFGQQSLSDEVLESLFKTALILFYCGYSNSLRIPKEEGIAYIAEVLNRESIEKSFKEAFNEVGKVGISQTHLKIKINLWILSAVDLALLVIHWLYEIYAPIEFSPFGLQFTFDKIPVFLLTAIIVTAVLISYLYRLEGKIIKQLRRGKNEK